MAEQSENVSENKGQPGKRMSEARELSGGLAQTLPLNVCDAPKAQVVPLALTSPCGTSQTPHIGVCAGLNGMAES